VKIKILLILAVLIGITGTAINSAWALNEQVTAGFDFFKTDPRTFVTLPADSFAPGIPPDDLPVPMEGVPIGPGETDTIVERLTGANVDNIGESDTIPIELVALSLRSIDPVDLSPLGIFDMDVIGGADLGVPQSQGSMTIFRDFVDGGFFDATLPVDAFLTFTEVGNPGNTFQVPFFDVFDSSAGSWSHIPRLDSCTPAASGGFFAAVDPQTQAKAPLFELAAFALHVVVPCQNGNGNGGVGGEYFTLDSTALLVAGLQTNLAWIIPVAVSTVGIGAFLLRKKF